MAKVKIFRDSIESQESITKLENQVNEWLAGNPDIEVVDIKYSDAFRFVPSVKLEQIINRSIY